MQSLMVRYDIKNEDINTICYYNYYENIEDYILLFNELLKPFYNKRRNISYKRRSNESEISSKLKCVQINKHKSYYIIPCSFDCETTNYGERAYVWLIQFAIGKNVLLFRTIKAFFDFLEKLYDFIKPSSTKKLLIFDLNLGFEFQNVLKSYLDIVNPKYDSFFKEKTEPIYLIHKGFFEFRECVSWGQSLKGLSKNYTRTQKMIGDLDYSILRNSQYNMNNTELGYCLADVIILTEFWGWFYNKYLIHHHNPLTIQGDIRLQFESEFLKQYPNRDIKKFKELQGKSSPKNKRDYIRLMNGLYRGGYVHSQVESVGYVYAESDNTYGYDITSSYPFCMLCGYVPDRFEYLGEVSETKFNLYLKTKCVMFRATFKNIKSTNIHSLESMNKLKVLSGNCVVDNGRLYSCDGYIQTWLNEKDFDLYKHYYTWESIKIDNVYIARRVKLPKWYINVLLQNYIIKAKLKEQKQNYAYEKSICNSIYGCACTSLRFNSLNYNGIEFSENENEYENLVGKSMLLPQWGVWITSTAKHRIMKLTSDLYEQFNKRVIYIDTDSVKILNFDKTIEKYINNLNKEVVDTVKKNLDYYKYEYDYIVNESIVGETLGAWDLEYQQIGIKVMGAKRYLIKENEKYKSTVAGLPKKVFEKYCDDNNLNPFVEFKNGLTIKNCKLRSVYNNEYHCDIINGELMEQNNSLALVDTDFTLKVKEDWIDTMKMLSEQLESWHYKQGGKFYGY